LGNKFVQEPQALGHQVGKHQTDASDISTGPVKAGDKPTGDRVAASAEHNWNFVCCRLGGLGRSAAARGKDDGHLAAHQIGG
jgi:hypothetical protein